VGLLLLLGCQKRIKLKVNSWILIVNFKFLVPLTLCISKALQIRAAKVASRSTADEILKFVERKEVEIPIELIDLRELSQAFGRLERGEVSGRIVVDLWK
jgi:propanol-preferring alcohol dehydrogenase